jgi:tetratricopeptide (TPR) repeat protein
MGLDFAGFRGVWFERRGTKMWLIAFFLAVLVGIVPAAAQGWKEYNYPDYSFTVSFPANPQIETTIYQGPDGRSVEAHVYSVTQGEAVFKMTIVDLSNTAMEESAVIDHAIKTLSEGGEIKIDIPARINLVYGHQLSIVRADGGHSLVAVFYHKDRLYQIEGKALPTGNDAASDVIRFQQSLDFTGGESNRPDVAVYLPAFSLDLNPIERVFSHLKEFLRKAAERNIPSLWVRIRYYIRGDGKALDQRIIDYTEAIRVKPKQATAYNNRGVAYQAKGDYNRAIADFNEAIRINPKHAIAYNNRGVAYQAKDDNNRAIADYNEAIRLDPKFALAYCNRGLDKRANGDAEGANSDIAEAKQLDPNVGNECRL